MNSFRFGGVFEVTVDEPALLKALENQRNYVNFLRRISNRLAREVRRFTPVETGRLRDSILPLDPEQDTGVVVQSGKRVKPKYVAGITIGASTTKNRRADLAPYWSFVEYGTGLRGLFTEIRKPIGNPSNWRYGFVNGQNAQGYIRKGLRATIEASKKGTL